MELRPDDDDESFIDEAVELGAEVLSAGAGAGAGLIVAGPPGALVGAVGAPLLQKAVVRASRWAHDRFFGARSTTRWGAVLLTAVERLQEYQANPEVAMRTDFLDAGAGERSPAEEILEGLFRTAVDAHEERKLPWIGRMYASLMFTPIWVTQDTANHYIRLAGQISWRQLCLLRGAHEDTVYRPALNMNAPRDPDWEGQVRGLMGLGLATQGMWAMGPPRPERAGGLLDIGWEGHLLDDIRFTYAATVLAYLMDLDQLPDEDYYGAWQRPVVTDDAEPG